MIQMLFQNPWVKVEKEHLPLVQKTNNISSALLFLILLLLPTQLGLHFWPNFAYVSGQRIDYLSPTLYTTDILIGVLGIVSILNKLFSVIPAKIGNQVFRHSELDSESNSRIPTRGLFSKRGRKSGKTNKFILIVGILWLTLGIFFSQSPFAGWYGLLKLFEFVFLGWFITTRAKQSIQFLKITLPIGIIVESILAMWQFILQGSVGELWYFLGERTFNGSTPGIANASLNGSLVLRPYGTFPHPNILAGFLLVGLVFIATFFRKAVGWKKIMVRGVLLIGGFTLCLTLSRTAIVLGVAMVAILVFHIIAFKTKKQKFQIIGASVLGLLILAFFLFPRFTGVNITGESLVLREQLMQASWQMLMSRPLSGVGLNSFLSTLPLIAPRLPLQPVHNIFLLILAETGILGLLGFLYFLFRSFRHIWSSVFGNQLMKNNRIFVLLFFFIWVSVGLVDHYFLTLQQGQLLTALMFGLCWATEKN